jgi:RNA polymerase sigma-70 factor (ECF subfamily)
VILHGFIDPQITQITQIFGTRDPVLCRAAVRSGNLCNLCNLWTEDLANLWTNLSYNRGHPMTSDSPYPVAELFRRCVQGETVAWEELYARYNPVIAGTAVRKVLQWGIDGKAVFEDKIQEVYEKLWTDRCRILGRFTYSHEGADFKYVAVVTERIVHDSLKSQNAQKRGSGRAGDALPEDFAGDASSFGGAAQIERQVLLGKVQDCLDAAGVSARDQAVFWNHYRDGNTAAAIASISAIHLTTKGVESLLWRLMQLVRACMNPSDDDADPDEKKSDSGESGGGKES